MPFVLAEGDYDAPPEKLWDAMRAKKYVPRTNYISISLYINYRCIYNLQDKHKEGKLGDDAWCAVMNPCVLLLVLVSVGVMQPLIDPFFEGYHTLKTFPDDPNIEVHMQ